MQLGGVLSGLGGAVAVAYWVYTLESGGGQSFWSLPGIAGLVLTVVGLVVLVAGLMMRDDATQPIQKQQGGDNSTNYQAGGDMQIGRDGHDAS